MGFADYILIGAIVLIVGLAAFYVVRAKRKGVNCIGCPSGCNCSNKDNEEKQASVGCSGNCSCCSGCTGHQENDN